MNPFVIKKIPSIVNSENLNLVLMLTNNSIINYPKEIHRRLNDYSGVIIVDQIFSLGFSRGRFLKMELHDGKIIIKSISYYFPNEFEKNYFNEIVLDNIKLFSNSVLTKKDLEKLKNQIKKCKYPI